jgi:hypothetical protein
VPVGRPRKEFDKKLFESLIGIGCTAEEICFVFRDDSGKDPSADTLSRWCKRTYGMDFKAYHKKNGGLYRNIQLRKNQMKLSEKSAAMAIFLGKQYLGQSDTPTADVHEAVQDDALTASLRELAERMDKEE